MAAKIGPRELALREQRAKPATRGIFITPLVGTIKPGMIVTDEAGKVGRIVAAVASIPAKKPKKSASKRWPKKRGKR
jgi:hypothetical protein